MLITTRLFAYRIADLKAPLAQEGDKDTRRSNAGGKGRNLKDGQRKGQEGKEKRLCTCMCRYIYATGAASLTHVRVHTRTRAAWGDETTADRVHGAPAVETE